MSYKNSCHALFSASVVLIFTFVSQTALGWTDDIDSLPNINTLCKPEPEAQCTQAVRVGLEAPGVDWRDSSMTQMRLDGANLQGANLSGSILQLANLKGANLMLANLTGAHLHAVNLQDSNLTMANLSSANLLDADLSGANLLGANLQKAILIQAKFGGATWPDGRVCAQGSVGECL
ncbi:MAG: pentapeptide repeat-containing protein [Proteobacteria bacterium]|nr:pentapeptide repeat-containing protein [Pseudomonadota bacterium]